MLPTPPMCRRPIPNGSPTSARLKPGVSREILRAAPERSLRRPKPTCSSSRSCRRSSRPGRMRERRRAMAQASRAIQRWPVSLITSPYQSPQKSAEGFIKLAAKLPAPIPPHSRAEPHQRKQRRSHDTPCPSCGSPTARSPSPSAYRRGQRSPNSTPNRQRRRIPSRKS